MLNQLYEILKQDKALQLAPGVRSILTEEKANWSYAFRIHNATNTLLRVAILTAGINTARVVSVSGGQYQAIGGGSVSYSGSETMLLLYDRPDLLNVWAQLAINCVATTTIDGRSQTIFAIDDTQTVIFENTTYNGGIDFFRRFVELIPVRIFQMQINSNSIEQFSQKIVLRRVSPFMAMQTEEVPIEDYFRPEQKQNKVIIDRPIIVGADTILAIDVPAQTETTFTFKASAVLNARQELDAITDLIDIANKIQNLKP